LSKHLFRTVGLAIASIMATAPALANEVNVPLGLYVGAGITQSRFDARTFSVDNKDKSWKAITGWRFHDSVALELNYVDFGKATAPAAPLGVPSATEATATSLFVLGIVPLQWLDLYAKVGGARTQAKGSIRGVPFRDSSTKLAYGGGLAWRLDNLAIRAEYEKYTVNSVKDLDLITLALTYTFGGVHD
jgi:opacity protein-like surface antigen